MHFGCSGKHVWTLLQSKTACGTSKTPPSGPAKASDKRRAHFCPGQKMPKFSIFRDFCGFFLSARDNCPWTHDCTRHQPKPDEPSKNSIDLTTPRSAASFPPCVCPLEVHWEKISDTLADDLFWQLDSKVRQNPTLFWHSETTRRRQFT